MQDLHYFDPYTPDCESPTYKIFPDSQGGGTVLEALAGCVFPSAWKKNKAISLFLQSPCLRISVRRLCTGKPIFRQHFHNVLYSGCYHLHSTITAKGFPLLHALYTINSLSIFDDGLSDRCKVIPCGSF